MCRALKAAANTAKASDWTFLFARLFGRRSSFQNDFFRECVRITTWRGKEYFLSAEKEVERV